jgi:hypothetical protein
VGHTVDIAEAKRQMHLTSKSLMIKREQLVSKANKSSTNDGSKSSEVDQSNLEMLLSWKRLLQKLKKSI